MARTRGFTLVELMTALAVVAVLLGLGVPAWQSHVRRAGRADAVQALVQLQLAQERHRTTFGRYAAALAEVGAAERSPQGQYRIELQTAGAESYLARAVAQAESRQAGDGDCRTLTLDVRQGFASTGPDGRCWNR